MITLETRALRDVPIGGVFIWDNNKLFNAVFLPDELRFEPYVRLPNDEWGLRIVELIYISGDGYCVCDCGDVQVAYTGVVLNVD